MKSKFIYIVILFGFSLPIFAQVTDSIDVHTIIGNYVLSVAGEENSSELYNYLEDLAENKININKADYVTLSQIPFLSQNDISKILTYRTRHKKYSSIYELRNSGISNRIYFMLKPFVTLGESKSSKWNFSSQIRTRVINNVLSGNENVFNSSKTYARLISKLNNFGFNAVIEKDAYEKNLLDYKSFNLLWKSNSHLNTAIIGNYVFEFGQGLVLWSPYSFSKSGDIRSSSIKTARTIVPYKSTDEVRFFRGGGFRLDFSGFSASLFYSDKPYETTIHDDTFSSITGTGLHLENTSSYDKIRIKTYGGTFSYENSWLKTSLLYVGNNFSIPLSFGELEKNRFSLYSLEANLRYGLTRLTTETAYNGNGIAGIYVLSFNLGKRISLYSSFRYYSPKYYSLFARGFGEYGKTNNERGLFVGAKISTAVGRISFYYDLFNQISADEKNPFPLNGDEMLIEFSSANFLNNIFYVRAKREIKNTYELLENSETKNLTKKATVRVRIYLKSKLSKVLFIKSQFDLTYFLQNEKSVGYSFSEMVTFNKPTIKITGSLSFFDARDYGTRIYLYEYDLDGVFRNSMFYGEGLRLYLLAKFRIWNSLLLQFKIAATHYLNTEFIDVETHRLNKSLSFQLEYRFD